MFVGRVLAGGFLAAALLTSGCDGTNNTVAPTEAGRVEPPGQPGNGSTEAKEPPATSRSCNVEGARWAIGQRASDDLLERARVAAGARVARFLEQGQPITMEFLAARLNLELDKARVVVGVRCG